MLLFLSWAFLHHPKNVRALFPYLYSQRHPLNFLCSVTVTTDFFLARLRPSPFFSRAKTSQCADWPGCFFPFNLRAEASGLAFFFFSPPSWIAVMAPLPRTSRLSPKPWRHVGDWPICRDHGRKFFLGWDSFFSCQRILFFPLSCEKLSFYVLISVGFNFKFNSSSIYGYSDIDIALLKWTHTRPRSMRTRI